MAAKMQIVENILKYYFRP